MSGLRRVPLAQLRVWAFLIFSATEKPLPLGEVASLAMTERASLLRQSRRTAISSPFVRAILSAVLVIPPSAPLPSQALRASSPKGRATGVSVRPALGEKSSSCRERQCPATEIYSSLTRNACPEAAGLCSKARPFAPYQSLRRPAQSCPVCQRLPLWGSWRAKRD